MFTALLALLLLQSTPRNPALAEHIRQLLHTMLTADDDKAEEAARTEARNIVKQRGLLSIKEIGDDAAYALVFLTCSPDISRQATAAASRHQIPQDAATLCAAHLKLESAKAAAARKTPSIPALRDLIEALYKPDQAVREKDSDMAAMAKIDALHRPALEQIFAEYGVPTWDMVGPEAASHFVVMVQHQSPELRRNVLPKLKANVAAGQAEPGSYALVYDRSQTDSGGKQLYGENLVCDAANPQLHTGSIEDEPHVDERRAQLGLMRLALYKDLVIGMSPNFCGSLPK